MQSMRMSVSNNLAMVIAMWWHRWICPGDVHSGHLLWSYQSCRINML